jgi:hypothetical protein
MTSICNYNHFLWQCVSLFWNIVESGIKHHQKSKQLYTFNQAQSEDAVAAALHFNGRRSLRAPLSLVWSSWMDAYPWQKLTWPMARWANKMKSTSLEVYNWHQFVIIITFSDNVCPYLVLVHVFSSLEVYFFTANLNKEWMLRQDGGFLRVLLFPPPIKLTATI